MYAAAPDGIGAQTSDIGGALCLRLDAFPQVTMFNRALGLGLDEPATEHGLDQILEFLAGTHAYVSVAPGARPAELPQWLEARGLAPGSGWTKFMRSTAGRPKTHTNLRVKRVATGEAFGPTAARGFEAPELFDDWLGRLPGREGWHCFVAFDGDEPTGAGALYVTGAIGWVGVGATVPEHRGKGAQSANIGRRIESAAGLGCELVVTETGAPVDGVPGPSYRNLTRAGFEPAYVRANYERGET